jgi:RNA polymerase sigma factor (sigma-70 family)
MTGTPSPAVTDAALIADYLAGNQSALVTLLERYRPNVERSCKRYKADPQDVMQDCYVRAISWLPAFDASVGQFSHWISKTAWSLAAQHSIAECKKTSFRNRWSPPLSEALQPPDARFERAQDKWMLGRAVSRLRPEPTRVLQLRYWEEHDWDSVSREMGKPVGTLAFKLSYTLDRLYEDMGYRGIRPRVRTSEIGRGAKRYRNREAET